MEEYFPDVVAILEKRKKERAPLRRIGFLFRNTRPPQTESSKMRERGGEGEGEFYERGPGGNGQRVGGGNGGGGEGRTSTSHTTQADSNQRIEGSPPAPFPPEENEVETEETDPQALTDASRKGDLLKVKHTIEDGRAKLNLDMQDENGKTALILASANGHTDIVRLLVDAKAYVDMQDRYGKTALILASFHGHTDIVRLLVDAKANVDMQDSYGQTALILASENGHTDIVRLLVDAKANVDMQDRCGKTALILASFHGHTDIVRLLVDAKANVDMQGEIGKTALILASENGHTDIVRLLVDAEANVDMQDENGKTALILASENGHTDIVRLLVDAKANVDMQDTYGGQTGLILASEKGHTDIVRLLVDAKANVDMQDRYEKTALILASFHGHTDIVRLLVDAKANVDMQDSYGQTGLILASENGHTDIVRLLVDAKASVDIQDEEGNSVLMLAIQKENVEMVEYLLAQPGSATQTVVNIPDSQDRTPLFRAAAGGHILLVELLLRRGADPSLKDASGNTALAVAEEARKMQVVDRLKSGERMVDPWSTEMVSEWNDLRSLIDSEAVAFWPLHFLRSLLKKGAKLPYRQKVAEAAKDLGVVCEPFSARTLAADLRHPVGAPFKLVAFSYPWLSQEHPDAEGFRLRSVLKHLDKQWWAQEGSPVTAFVFWDYLSLFQHPPGGRRTDAQDALFIEGLSKMDLIYSSPHTHVIRSTAVPESAANPTKYIERGWCWFESAVTAFKPPAQVLSDDGDQERPSLRIPATPLRFGETLDTKKFTNGKADAEGVKALYKNFLHRSIHKLRVFADGSWASSREDRKQMDPQAALQLTALVEYVVADPSLAARLQPQVLDLRGSPFDDAALHRFADFPSLKESSKLTLSLERLLCTFGKLGSITAVSFEALDVSRSGDDDSKKVYMEGLQRGLAGLFLAEGPCPLDVNLRLLASAGMREVIGRLIRESKTVNVDVRDEERGETALMFASFHGHTDIVRLLVDAKASLDMQDKNGKTALILASENGHTDIMRLLVDAKANVDIQDEEGISVLMLASFYGHTDIVRLLVDAKANVDMQDSYGQTGLILASENGHTDIVRLLVDAKANVDVQNKNPPVTGY
uniref:Uncharacterized protein n=1 Tax=Chromera velia CCMP2878 TaxID=1169474 RepID=A0A0G4HXG7_9ALVE|eukprot:Cvel_9253.t1-p1 / transcript=Cvel_9253.t1 / gene=Cvel_9253 / organism=Chromera_velia_CCMP2878 / gene_product=Ankyrin repeat domain-containing protein 50, putative / transcript_product=Ankyrin repeat domain-containing protein 50, putative / location=Cvel_scaffold529:8510-12725(+) / protein_length=1107 / sequence_SO=supercontig / SO=protein_coding / is_pseudo=false